MTDKEQARAEATKFNNAVAKELILNTARWTANILNELLNNYRSNMPDEARKILLNCTTQLHSLRMFWK